MRAVFHSLIALLATVTLCLLAPNPAQALVPGGNAMPETPVETQAIAQDRDGGEDSRIEQRIEGIFLELPAFERVETSVKGGVVTLSGIVPAEADIDRAENIVSRIQGVVTIENGLERDTSVESGLGALGDLSDRVEHWIALLPLIGIALLAALLIASVGYFVAGLDGIWRRVTPNSFLAEIVASAIRFIFVTVGLVIALDMLGAATLLGAVLGGAGVVGIALGFAMRDTIENYVASLMLSLRQPFRANDHVLIGEFEGRVVRLTSRATILMTLDGNHLRIPNAQVFKAVILNYTRNPQRRFEFELGIDADDDARAAMKLGAQALAGLAFVLDQPEPSARIQQVGDSNIVILYLGWVDQREADWFKSRSLAIATVKDALEEAGFALPEPIYRLRFDGRSEPLTLGRSATVQQTDAPASPLPPSAEPAAKPPAVPPDVKPEREIADMVEEERRNPDEQVDDLLDSRRPVE